MKTLIVRSFLILSTLALSCPLTSAQSAFHENPDGWQHLEVEDGISLYFKEGTNGTRIYKAVGTINALLPEVSAQLMDVEHYDEWMHGFTHVEVLGTERDGSRNLYIQAQTPAFTANRDVVTNVVFFQSEGAILAKLTNRPTLAPNADGFTRIPVFSGYVAAVQGNNETCKVTLQCEVDLGDNLPAAVVDFQMKKIAAETLRMLRKEFQQPLVRENGNVNRE